MTEPTLRYRYWPEIILAIHVVLGLLLSIVPSFTLYFGLLVTVLGTYFALSDPIDRPTRTLIAAGYLSGLELVFRISQAGLPHEFVKYAVTLLLAVAWLRSGMRLHLGIAAYFLLLLPAMLLTVAPTLEGTRQLISANLSGPLCLTVSSLFFCSHAFQKAELVLLLRWIVNALVVLTVILIVRSPDLAEIDFGSESNFQTSLYGPNQVSSILGLGLVIIGIGYLMKLNLFNWPLQLAVAGAFLFRGLLTFSRGGMLTAVLVIATVYLLILFSAKATTGLRMRVLLLIVAGSLAVYGLFQYTNQVTDNALFNRYAGIKSGRQLTAESYTSGRLVIAGLDWLIFTDHPVGGVGIGMSKAYRAMAGYEVTAHIEFTRMLAEHGLPGMVSMLIMILMPVIVFVKKKRLAERVFIVAGTFFCFSFMLHSATRIAAPMLLYGFVFITFYQAKSGKTYKVKQAKFVHGTLNFSRK